MDLGAMAMKGCSTFPKLPASLEPRHQIVYLRHSLRGLIPLQRCSQCILKLQLTRQLDFRVTFIYLLSLFKRLLCRLKVLSLIIFITLISSHLILVVFFSWFALLKLGCVSYTHVSYIPSNTIIFKQVYLAQNLAL